MTKTELAEIRELTKNLDSSLEESYEHAEYLAECLDDIGTDAAHSVLIDVRVASAAIEGLRLIQVNAITTRLSTLEQE